VFDNIQSVGGSALSLFESSFDISDIAFLQMIACIMDTEQSLRAHMEGIQQRNAEKSRLVDEIEALNRALRDSGATKNKDWINAGPEALENYREELRSALSEKEEALDIDSVLSFLDEVSTRNLKAKCGLAVSENSNVCVNINGDTKIFVSADMLKLAMAERGYIRKGDLDSRIEELQNRVSELDSSSQLELIDLNRMINQYQQRVQLVSTLESRDHQTNMKLIDNLR